LNGTEKNISPKVERRNLLKNMELEKNQENHRTLGDFHTIGFNYQDTLTLLFGFLFAPKLTLFPLLVLKETGLFVLVFFLLAKNDGILI